MSICTIPEDKLKWELYLWFGCRGRNVHTVGTPDAATKHGISTMMMATFPMIATNRVPIIMFVTDIDFHRDGVDDYIV